MMDEERTSGTGGGVIGRWAGIYTLGDIGGEGTKGDARLIIVQKVTDAATGEAGSWHVLERGKARWAARRLGPMHSAHTRPEQASTLWNWPEGCSRNWWKGTMIGLEVSGWCRRGYQADTWLHWLCHSLNYKHKRRRRRAARDLVWATNHTTLASTRTPGAPPPRQRTTASTTNHLNKNGRTSTHNVRIASLLPITHPILPIFLPVLCPPLMASFADGILLRQTVTQPPAPPPDLERSHMGFGLKSLDTDWPFGRPLQHFGPGGRFHLVWAMKGGAPSRPLTSSPALKLAWRELSGCLCNEPQSSNVLLPLKLTPTIHKDIQLPDPDPQSSLNSHGGCVLNVATNESNKRARQLRTASPQGLPTYLIWSIDNKLINHVTTASCDDEYDERDEYNKYNKYNKCDDYKTNCEQPLLLSSLDIFGPLRLYPTHDAMKLKLLLASNLSGVPHNRILPALGGKKIGSQVSRFLSVQMCTEHVHSMRVDRVGVSICFTQACPSQCITRIGQNAALPTQPSYTSTKVVILSCYTSILCADNLTYSRNWNRMFDTA
ncbi:hypothetical protein A9K55_003395 [Cordyceps militaris]|uniref:Uncharacterized protein n=1 Tax=Cordyceps militaris TaxID=73501 RepID=A0A2H4S6L0_CORMI|nr:hypothetical protein A9K55_003395 [Cordyceps militaris]